MSRTLLFLFAAFGAAALTPQADARPRDREQDAAFRGTKEGRFIPLRVIESRIIPRMRGFDYLGPELDPGMGLYRLKFMRGAQVIWIDVDARTGQVVGKSGF
ncbi:hypothetical protein [Sphingosinicella rhizophila]|uniref:PepSY domain-containing protein n=1 Tax=Sphingosinicella rhizophila TaxID=3050082 RepID=A0ABU3QC69_9SPHN|nr:hypothetical protein [Sphingosinicella sp. GR2756]MDT9600997.1 hypothetical protein [Sphingosinicella sp. GR2756]